MTGCTLSGAVIPGQTQASAAARPTICRTMSARRAGSRHVEDVAHGHRSVIVAMYRTTRSEAQVASNTSSETGHQPKSTLAV